MKLCIVVGARPNFIKAAPLIAAIKKYKKEYNLSFVLIHTGQHYDKNMSDIFFSEMKIPKPHYSLQIGSNSHGAQTGEMMAEIEKVLLKEKPDFLFSIGDTNSTLAGALAAAKLNIPIAHVEAGLRSYDKSIPEELNRLLTDHVSKLLFVPTKSGHENLLKEGISKKAIYNYGDIMYDAVLQFNAIAQKRKVLKQNKLESKKYVLATLHRAENTSSIESIRIILDALVEINKKIKVILPIHPRTKNILVANGLLESYEAQLTIVEPVGYIDILCLENNAAIIITDSGGIQKEAFFQRVPCVTLFESTVWVELVEAGWNVVVPPKTSKAIVEGTMKMLEKKGRKNISPYGKGDTAELIIKKVISFLKK
jgi:UDP-GlcNAc3NAcA epimerase